MGTDPIAPEDEMARAATLPQADASSLVDREVLEAEVQEMYRHVAREEDAALHFAVGRQLALRLGYPRELLDGIPLKPSPPLRGSATTSTSPRWWPETGARPRLGLRNGRVLRRPPGRRFGRVVGVDFTDEQVAKASRLRDRDGLAQAEFLEASIDSLPFEDHPSTSSSRTG